MSALAIGPWKPALVELGRRRANNAHGALALPPSFLFPGPRKRNRRASFRSAVLLPWPLVVSRTRFRSVWYRRLRSFPFPFGAISLSLFDKRKKKLYTQSKLATPESERFTALRLLKERLEVSCLPCAC